MKHFFVFICVCIALLSCSSDIDNPPLPETCYSSPVFDSPLTSTWLTRTYNYMAPCFNPENSNEFAYIRCHFLFQMSSGFELRKHNLSTNDDVFLASIPNTPSHISWNNSGWIYFDSRDNANTGIYKVRDNGQDLTQVIPSANVFWPISSPSGQYLTCYGYSNTSGLIPLVINQSSMQIDTISQEYSPVCWINDTLIFMAPPISIASFIISFKNSSDCP